MISHRLPNGSEKPIAHADRVLTKAERNYGQIEKEALAVRKFHRYVWGWCFMLLAEHIPLLSIFGSKTGISVHSENRLQLWGHALLACDFELEYRRHALQSSRMDTFKRALQKLKGEETVECRSMPYLPHTRRRLQKIDLAGSCAMRK